MYGYIYLTTNLANGKKYIGKHKAEEFENLKYIGSGLLLWRDIEANNFIIERDFKVEILKRCETLEELNHSEIEIIDKYNAVKDINYYNIAPGGDGGDIALYLSEEQLQEIYARHSIVMKQIWATSPETYLGKVGAKEGHIMTEETKNKQSESATEYWSNLSEEKTEERREASRRGAQKEETKEKRANKMWVNNGLEEIEIKKDLYDEYEKLGYVEGRLSVKGSIWITNGEVEKRIKPEILNKYKNLGFWHGRMYHDRKKKS